MSSLEQSNGVYVWRHATPLSREVPPFSNQGILATSLGLWLLFVACLLPLNAGEYNSFFTAGPSDTSWFLGMKVDTWDRWAWIMSFTVLTQALKIAADEVRQTFRCYCAKVCRNLDGVADNLAVDSSQYNGWKHGYAATLVFSKHANLRDLLLLQCSCAFLSGGRERFAG
jgi:hypothetical protein